jgi:hypothetical protein
MVRPRRAGATARFNHSVTPIILWLMRQAGCGPWFVDEAGLDYPAIHPARPFPIPLLLNAAARRHSAIQQTRLPSWPRRRVQRDGGLRRHWIELGEDRFQSGDTRRQRETVGGDPLPVTS